MDCAVHKSPPAFRGHAILSKFLAEIIIFWTMYLYSLIRTGIVDRIQKTVPCGQTSNGESPVSVQAELAPWYVE